MLASVAPEVNKDLVWGGAKELSHSGPALLERLSRAVADRVQRGWVAEPIAKIRQHGFDDSRIGRLS